MRKFISILVISLLITFLMTREGRESELFGADTTVTVMELQELSEMSTNDYLIVVDSSAGITKRISANGAIIVFLNGKTIDTLEIGHVYSDTIYIVTGIGFYSQSSTINDIQVGNLLDATIDDTVSGEWTFSDTCTIGGVSSQNLLDKTANETISGKYTYSDTVDATYFKLGGTQVTSSAEEMNMLDGATTTHHIRYQERGYATQTNITAGTTNLSGYCGGAYEISANTGQVIINLPAASGGNATMFLNFWVNNADNTITIAAAAEDSIYIITGDSTWVYSDQFYMKDVNSSVLLCPTSPDTWAILGGGHGIDLK